VSRFTVNGLARPTVVLARPPFGDRHVTPYPLIEAPLPGGGSNETLRAWLETLNAEITDGAAGAPTVIGGVETDDGPTPPPVGAATVNDTDVPSVRPEITVVVKGPKTSIGNPPDGVTT